MKLDETPQTEDKTLDCPFVAIFGHDKSNGRFPYLSAIIDRRTNRQVAGGWHATLEEAQATAPIVIQGLMLEE